MICPGPIRLYPAQKDQNGVRATAAGSGNLLVWVFFCGVPRAGHLTTKIISYPPSRTPQPVGIILSYVRAIHDAHPPAQAKASHNAQILIFEVWDLENPSNGFRVGRFTIPRRRTC